MIAHRLNDKRLIDIASITILIVAALKILAERKTLMNEMFPKCLKFIFFNIFLCLKNLNVKL